MFMKRLKCFNFIHIIYIINVDTQTPDDTLHFFQSVGIQIEIFSRNIEMCFWIIVTECCKLYTLKIT